MELGVRAAVGWARARVLAGCHRIRQRGNHGIYAVELDGGNGFFAQLTWCLYILAHCEARGRRPYIALVSGSYGAAPGDDWLRRFFDVRSLPPEDERLVRSGAVRISRVRHIRELGRLPRYARGLTLPAAHALLGRHLTVKPEITGYVDAFARERFGGGAVLGVHYRGTDKWDEAPPVDPAQCLQAVRGVLARLPGVSRVFVSSDEASFVERARSGVLGVPVVAHDDSERSTDRRAPYRHPSRGDNSARGRDALVNCLLLARCRAVVRTASFLSGWASVFNPDLRVFLLNRPYPHATWFPDRAVLRAAGTERLDVGGAGG